MWKQGDGERIAGAGAILFSKLCSQGFFLPATAITDQDEKILFDVEVKLKLKHASARNQLWTIVADFPPSVLLQRQELLIALLNGIGAPFSHEDVLVDPLGLHAIGCLRVFRLLLSKVRSEVSVFFDWGLVNEGHLEGRKRQLEHTVSLRYPTLRLGANAGSVAVSGLAFAVLAAALPLLQSRSLLVMQSLGDLASVALDLVFEPSCGRDSSAQETNGRRARHLVGRLEQLAQVLSLESLLADSQDRSCQAIATAEDLADRIFLSAFARFASYFLRTLRRLLGDSLMLPASLSKLEDCLFCQNEDACRVPLLPVAALIACLDRPNSHVALRNSLGALSLGAQFDLLEEGGYDTDILQLLQQLAGLLEALPMSRAEQESYVLCLSTTVRLLQAVAAHCGRGDPLHASHNIAQNLVVKVCLLRTSTSQAPARSRGLQQTHLYNQILCNIMASVKRVTTHAVSFAHQMSDTSSSASAEEAFTRSVQLHAISLTRYVTATAALEEVEIELSDLLQHLLVRVLLDENCHVECRLSLMQTLQDMLGSPGHCALLDKFCHSLFTQTCFSDRWHEGVKGEVANQPGTLLQVYVRIAKVIASPDSFGRSALLSYCLKAVHTILHLDGPLGAEIQPLSNWVWLQRYLYDHRSAFKSFALQIFTRVVQSSAMTDDNTLVPSFAHQLLEGVYHIVIDQHESRVVRAHAMHLAILLYFPADGTRLSQSDECALSLPHLVDAIGELLGRSNDSKLAKSGLASVALATSDELLLITRVLCLLWRNSEAQRLVHSNRIVPLLIELLNPLYCQMGAKQRQAMLGIETGKKQDGGDYCPNYLERLLTKQKEGHFVSATHIYTFLLQLCDDQPQWIEDSARFGSLIAHVSADIVSLNSEENKGVTEEMFLCRLVAVFSLLYRLHHLSHCNEQCVQKAPGSLYNDSLMLLNRAVIVLRDSSEAGLRSAGGLHRQVLQVGGRWAAYLLQAAGENQPRKIERDTLSHLVERLLSYRLNIFKQIVMTGSNVGMLTEYGETELEIAAAQVDVLIALTLHSHPASLYQLTTVLLNPPHAALLQYFLQTVKDCARYGEQKVGPLQVTSLSVSSVTTPGRFRGNNRVSPGSTASLRATSKWRNEARSYALSARDVLHTSSSSDDAASSSSHPLSSNRTVQPVLEQLGERARRRAAGALLVLQSMQPILSRVLSERDLDDLMQSIYLLQRKSFVSSLTLHVMHAEPVHFAHCMSLRAGQLASLLVMFVASLVSQDSCLRTAYIAAASKSHVAYLQQSRTAAQETSLLNWLLSVGLSSGQMPSFRRLSLHLAAELLPHMLPNTAEKLESQVAVPGLVQSSNALRNQATLLLAQHVEKTLQMSTYSQSDVHFALLPFFAALAHSEAGPCCYDKTNSAILPLPDLVATLCDASPSLGSAVCRGLGSVALWQTYALDMAVTPSSARQSENEENVSSATAPTLSLPTLSAKYLLHEKVFRVLANQSSREARTQETGGSSTPSLPPSILPLASLCVRLLSHRSDKVRTQLNAVRSNPHAKSTETRHW